MLYIIPISYILLKFIYKKAIQLFTVTYCTDIFGKNRLTLL